MKRAVTLSLLVLVILVASASVAVAARYDSTYTYPSTTSPHGGWTVNTVKCNVCHAVHNPGEPGDPVVTVDDAGQRAVADRSNGSEYLLRASSEGACVYCHVSTTFAIKTVYNEQESYYNGTAGDATVDARAHDIETAWEGCVGCHQVHAASTMIITEDDYLQSKLLKDLTYDGDSPGIVASANDTRDDVETLTNESVWCSGCHVYWLDGGDAAVGDTGNDTHIMKDAANSAAVASTYCTSCHDMSDSNFTDKSFAAQGENNFPHLTDGARFMYVAADSAGTNEASATANAAGQVNVDGACLKCHVNDDATVGIGIDY